MATRVRGSEGARGPVSKQIIEGGIKQRSLKEQM